MKILYTLLISGFALAINAQQTTESWIYDGETREYIQYVPTIYDGSEPVPVVFVFHGLGDTMEGMYAIGMDDVADTANFIVIVPQALPDALAGTAWNSLAGIAGVYFPNEDVDDVGFVMAMIDSLGANYNIDMSRIYATGFSMGGFFTNRLACERPEVFAAVASVAGTVGGGLDCNPSQPLRIAHFHGTSDPTVGYNDNLFGSSVPEWLQIWQDANGCVGDLEEYPLANPANDNFTIDYFRTDNCDENSEVVLYRVNGAGHVWLTPANDLFYTTEIWRFFLDVQPGSAVGVAENGIIDVGVYPNPAMDQLWIELPENFIADNVQFYDNVGRLASSQPFQNGMPLNISKLSAGFYVVVANGAQTSVKARFLKQ
jgi:polyhydroxybutyrate depolymerase